MNDTDPKSFGAAMISDYPVAMLPSKSGKGKQPCPLTLKYSDGQEKEVLDLLIDMGAIKRINPAKNKK